MLHERVHVAQRTYRTLLGALAHPGRVIAIADPLDAPAPFTAASAAAAFALFDADVAVWLAAHFEAAASWLSDVTGSRRIDDPSQAAFGVIDASALESFDRWSIGTAEEPESSATLLVHVDALTGGAPVLLRGPGIDGEIVFAPLGLPAAFWNLWAQNAACYPRGVDCFLFDDAAVAGLPRTTHRVPA